MVWVENSIPLFYFSFKGMFTLALQNRFNPVRTARKFYRKWIKSGSVRFTYGKWIEADGNRLNEHGGQSRIEVSIYRHVAQAS